MTDRSRMINELLAHDDFQALANMRTISPDLAKFIESAALIPGMDLPAIEKLVDESRHAHMAGNVTRAAIRAAMRENGAGRL